MGLEGYELAGRVAKVLVLFTLICGGLLTLFLIKEDWRMFGESRGRPVSCRPRFVVRTSGTWFSPGWESWLQRG